MRTAPEHPIRHLNGYEMGGNYQAMIGCYTAHVESWRMTEWPANAGTLGNGNTVLNIPQNVFRFSATSPTLGMSGPATAALSSVQGPGSVIGNLYKDHLEVQYTPAIGTIACTGCSAVATPNPSTPPTAIQLFSGTVASNQFNGINWNTAEWQTSQYAMALGVTFSDLKAAGGPYLFDNNYLDGVGEGFYIDPDYSNFAHDDVTYTHNHQIWPKNYFGGDAANLWRYEVRQHFEIKRGHRFLIQGNLFSYSWSYQNDGPGIFLSGRPTYIAQTLNDGISDITIQSNTISHGRTGIACQDGDPMDNGGGDMEPEPTKRISITNNLMFDLGRWKYCDAVNCPSLGSFYFENRPGCQDLVITNNTADVTWGDAPSLIYLGGGELLSNQLTFQKNILHFSQGVAGYGGGNLGDWPPNNVTNHDVTPAPVYSDSGAAPGFKSNLDQSIVNTAASVFPNYTWGNNVLIGGFTGSSMASAVDMSYAQVLAYAANMPPGDIYPSGDTIAARQAAAGLNTTTWRSSVYNSAGIGTNIDALNSAMGIVTGIQAPVVGPASAEFSYTAPDAKACAVDVSANGATWVRTTDSGGPQNRLVSVQGLTPGTQYQSRIICYFTQQNDGVLYTDYTPGEITTATFTTPAGTSQAAGASSLTITSPTSLLFGAAATIYSPVTFTATGGTGVYTWSATGLPGGLSFSTAGVLSGTPVTGSQGSYNPQFTVTDSSNTTATVNLALTINSSTINPSGLQITGPASLPSPIIGTAYGPVMFTASGGTGSYTWSATGLPNGLSISGAGALSGTPAIGSGGSYNPQFTAKDSSSGIASVNLALNINSNPLILNCNPTTGPAVVGSSYAASCTTGGGIAPYNWSISSGSLPTGISLYPTGMLGTIIGTPTAAGAYSYTVTVVDSSPQTRSQTQTYSGTILPGLTLNCSPASGPATPGTPYSATCTASEGTAPYTWVVNQGSLPSGLQLSASTGNPVTISGTPAQTGTYHYSVQVADSSPTPQVQSQSYSGTIGQAAPSSLTASSTGLTFNAQPGGSNPLPQSVSVFSNPGTASFTPVASGGSWLSVSSGSGTAPGSVVVSVNPELVTAGQSYSGAVTITGQNTTPATIVVPVALTVAANQPAQLAVSMGQVQLTYAQGSGAAQQALQVTNTGGGTLTFTGQAQTFSCGGWLTLLNANGSAAPGAGAVIGFQANPAGLTAGTCTGQITISNTANASQSPVVVPVTMVITAQSQSVVLSQTALNFTVTQGGTVATQTFGVLNAGIGAMGWTIQPCTLSTAGICNSSGWLSVTPLSGSSTAGSGATPLTVSVNPQGLAPGAYFGTLTVNAPQAGNSPKSVVVSLTVLPSGQFPTPQATPGGLILVGPAGAASSGAQGVTLTNFSNTALSYASTAVTLDGQPWLQQTPGSGTIPANSSVQMNVQANLAGLATGLWYGSLSIGFGDGTIQSIQVLLSVTGGSGSNTSAANAPISAHAATSSCLPGQNLLLQFQSPSNPFSVPAQQSVPVNVLVTQCDGTPFNGTAQDNGNTQNDVVFVQIGSSTQTLYLSPPSQQDGVWTTTWTPTAAVSGITLMGQIVEYGSGTVGFMDGQTVVVNGNVTAPEANAQPAVSTVQNAAGYPELLQITPGAWVAVIGAGLASGPALQQNTPYTDNLLTTQVTMQGQPLPLYYVSPGQVNALIPQVGVNQGNQQLIVTQAGMQSAGVDLQVISPQPGIFSADSTGTGQGSIVSANTGIIAGSTSITPPQQPVARGQFIAIFCTGLGPVNGTPPPDGSPAPSSPLLQTTVTPAVTIGGVPAPPPSFSGLAPGLVGVYQVNVQVPTSVAPGNAVQVSLTIGGVTSNVVTIAVQ